MNRLFSSVWLQILDSSLADNWQARHVFEDLLKLAVEGVVDMTREAIARRTCVPISVVNAAISVLESPDPGSRDPAEGGRRLVRLDEHRDWGWRIVNWAKYQNKMASAIDEEKRVANRNRQKKFRAEGMAELFKTPDLLTQAEQIYTHYPLKVAKPDALKAISRALQKVPFETLLEKTKTFALARGGDKAYCPFPSTWFNQERYNDDPSTWKRHDNTDRNRSQQCPNRNIGTYNDGKNPIRDFLAKQAATENFQ